MKLSKPILPKELDADVALSVIIPHAEAAADVAPVCSYEFLGVSERTALGDDLTVSIKNRQNASPAIKFSLKRDSLYHILPEYLFHSLDHYLGVNGDTEEFDKKYKEQEEQKNKALTYFKPFDCHFQQLRSHYQQWLNEHVFSGNHFLADFITEGFNVNLRNPFIMAVYTCIPWLRDYRGNEEMIKTALGYAFKGHADVHKMSAEVDTPIQDTVPTQVGASLGRLFCGATFKEKQTVWSVFYQTEIPTAQDLRTLREQIKEFQQFFSQWFLPIESDLKIEFGNQFALPLLADSKELKGVFLNYSTQLI